MLTAQKEKVKVKKEKPVKKVQIIKEETKGGELSDAMKNRLGHMAESFEEIGKEVVKHMSESVEKTIKHQLSLIEEYLMKKIHDLHGTKGVSEAKKHINKWKAALLKDIQTITIPKIRKTIKKNGSIDVEADVLEHISFGMIGLAKDLNDTGDKKSAKEIMYAVKSLIKSSDDEEDEEMEGENMMDRMSEEIDNIDDVDDEDEENEYFDEEIEIDSSKINQIKAFANKLASVHNGKYLDQAKKIIASLKNLK